MINYIYNESGFLCGEKDTPDGVIPPRSTRVKPKKQKAGFTQRYFGGKWSYVAFADIPAPVVDIDAVKSKASEEVDNTAFAVRVRLTSDNPLQVEVYKMKAAEADAYIAAGSPNSGANYPLLAGEAKATGMTKKQVADRILAAKKQWVTVLGTIEGVRINAKDAITAATTQGDVEAARASAVAELEAL